MRGSGAAAVLDDSYNTYMYNMYVRAPIRGGGGAIIFTWRDLRPTQPIIIGPIFIISSKKVTLAVGRALQFCWTQVWSLPTHVTSCCRFFNNSWCWCVVFYVDIDGGDGVGNDVDGDDNVWPILHISSCTCIVIPSRSSVLPFFFQGGSVLEITPPVAT